MKRILAVFKRDLAHARTNVVALLICMGLAVIPSLYAWFNIAGGWDPYGNTGQVKVALANSDEGLSGSLLPLHVNVGERVVNSLAGSDKVGYVVTSEDDAVEGVRSGKYYAAVIVPQNFTQDLLSVFSASPSHPQLDYYVNEKRNAIASIVTGKVSGSVQTMVDQGFTEAVTESAAEVLEELSGSLDEKGMLAVANNLNSSLDNSLRALERSADDIEAYRQVAESIRAVMESSSEVLGANSASLQASSMLSDAADGVRQFDTAVETAEQGAEDAIGNAQGQAQELRDAVDAAFDGANGKADELISALERVNDTAQGRADDLKGLLGKVEDLEAKVDSLSTTLDTDNLRYAREVSLDLSDYKARINNAISRLEDLVATGQEHVSNLQSAQGNAATNKEELEGLAEQARAGIESVRESYQNEMSGSLGSVADTIDNAASEAAGISTDLKQKANNIGVALSDASTGIKSVEDSLSNASKKLNDTAKSMRELRDRLLGAINSKDLDKVRGVLGTDPSLIVGFLTSPVELNREAMFAVENNGSAMTPYYTTMALWVGGTLAGILLYAGISEAARKETDAKPRHAYFGRLLFFLMLGACQSTILLLGDLFFLKVQCQNPLLFMLTGWVASFVFINIIYSLSTSFGDVGKAIGVLIMVLQVAGSGGTFPVQMLPEIFQKLYPFLPFVHSENAMRAAMFGTNGNDWLVSMATLAAFLIPALLLGLVLRKPLVPANEWIEEKMEETGLM